MTGFHSEIWFKEAFDSNYEHLRNFLYYLSGDISWSEDAVQEVFITLWEKRDTVSDDTLVPFIFTIGRNKFLKQKRHDEVRLKFYKMQPEPETEYTPTAKIETDEFDRKLQLALSELPAKCRSVFLMSRMDEMKNKQIAGELGISLKAVEKQITKALKILREKLDRTE
jgi:RNA polymerase sigma-70 factor (family 1)